MAVIDRLHRRIDPQIAQARIGDAQPRIFEQEAVDRVARDPPLDIAEHGVAQPRIGGRAQSREQPAHHRAVIAEIIILPPVYVVIGGLDMRDDRQVEGVAREHFVQPLRPVDRHDPHADADLPELRGHDLARSARIARRGKFQREIEAVRVTRRRQQRARARRIVGVEPGQVDIVRALRRHVAADRGAIAVHRTVDHLSPVDRVRDGAAHAHVGERAARIVHRQDHLGLARPGRHAQRGIAAQLREILGRGICGEEIDRVRTRGGEGGGGIGDEAEVDPRERHRAAPILRLADQRQPFAAPPAREAERAGADRRGRQHGRAAGRDHRAIPPCEDRRQFGIGRGEADADRVRAEDVDPRNAGQPFLERVGGGGRDRAAQAERGGIGIERRAVLETHAGAELEHVAARIGRHPPARGEQRPHRTGGIERGQPLEDRMIGDVVDRGRRARGGIERGRLQLERHDQMIARDHG